MTTSSETTVNSETDTKKSSGMRRCRSRNSCGGNWDGVNIAAMVLGFVFFGPLGLFILFWILTGRDVRDLPGAAKNLWHKLTGGNLGFNKQSGNTVFNEFQQTQYDRINEIKHEIKVRAERFKVFKEDAKRRADQEEFDRFMTGRPIHDES